MEPISPEGSPPSSQQPTYEDAVGNESPATPEDCQEESQESAEQIDGTPMDLERDEEEEHEEEDEDERVPDEEAIERSKVQKDAFLEMFRIAPTVRDILPDLRTFVNHPDVIKQDKMEVQQLVELKIQDEKAKKKAEKAKKEKEQAMAAEKPPIDLAQAIKSVTGLDLAGILQKTSQRPQVAPPIQPVLPQVINLCAPPVSAALQHLPPELANAPTLTLGKSTVTTIRVGKAGFGTPHPAETAALLKAQRPKVPPIPEALLKVKNQRKPEVAAIPNELLPLDQRVPVAPAVDPSTYVIVRPPIRKTLLMAGARAGKRSEIRAALAGKNNNLKKEKKEKDPPPAHNNRSKSFNRNPVKVRSGHAGWGDLTRMPSSLNKNTPLPVRRYHARQLAKDTGITFEKAMEEIEEQCNQFHKDDEETRDANFTAMEAIRERGDRRFNSRNNYVPADHSKGIPGVDRPPGGARKDRDEEQRDRDASPTRERERDPGYGLPAGYRERERERDPGYGLPAGYRERERERDPGYGLPAGYRKRNRGGVNERKKRRDERQVGSYGGGGGRDRYAENSRDGRDSRGPGGPSNKQPRYDEQPARQQYDDYNSYHQESGAYDGTQDYQGYYEGQEGYENYDQTGTDQYANYTDYYQGQEGQQGSYYQEDGSQYYNEYYGTSEGTAQDGYQASFDAPGTSRAP